MTSAISSISTNAIIEHTKGVAEGSIPGLTRIGPKTLFGWTGHNAFKLLDIGAQFFRSIPQKGSSWLRLGIKSTLLTAASFKFLDFMKWIPSLMRGSVDNFMIFALFVSGVKSSTKAHASYDQMNSSKGREWTKNLTEFAWQAYFTTSKILALYPFISSLWCTDSEERVTEDQCPPMDNTTFYSHTFY